jgi:signal transduction histidine kinase
LRAKVLASFLALVVALVAIDVAWSEHVSRQQAERDAYDKALIMADQMNAAWGFIDHNQSAFEGTDDREPLVCVRAAKAIAKLTTVNSDYMVRYVNIGARVSSDEADGYEAAAIEGFRKGAQDSVSGFLTDEEGNEVYRYVQPLYVNDSCLSCHGSPAGESDELGYPKEGLSVGDVAGALSITEPSEIYSDSSADSLAQQLSMTLIGIVVGFALLYVGIHHLVLAPVSRIEKATREISDGNLSYRIGPLSNDELGDLACSLDRTAEELQCLYGNLESQVEDRTAQLAAANKVLEDQEKKLNEANERLQQELDYKSDFFALTSHELKTPLTSILAYAELLAANPYVKENDKVAGAVREISGSGTVLLDMVNNILILTRADADRLSLDLEPVDFVDVLSSVRATFAPISEAKGQELTVKVHPDVPIVLADWAKMRRIVENLVNNAIKFTRRGGAVSVEASYDAESDEVVLAVADTGPGIDQDDLGEIFELYKQAKQSSSKRFRGSGLGLSVVKQLVELHGGTVSVESERHVGSTFYVRIPARHLGVGVI